MTATAVANPQSLTHAIRWRPLLACLIMASASSAMAQAASPAQPAVPNSVDPADAAPLAFDVATIKLVDPNGQHIFGVDVNPGGRVSIRGAGLKGLIAIAFQLSSFQIKGGEDWMGKDSYDVVAKPPEGMEPPSFNLRHGLFEIDDERLRQMLQALLIERFHLQFHRETQTGPVYLLEQSGKPLKLKPTADIPPGANQKSASFGSIGWAERWGLYNVTMPQFTKFAADLYIHRPVIDRTGLTGAFNYRGPDEAPIPGSGEPPESFLNMVNEIGLKLTPAKGPVEIFVIDHAENPSPN